MAYAGIMAKVGPGPPHVPPPSPVPPQTTQPQGCDGQGGAAGVGRVSRDCGGPLGWCWGGLNWGPPWLVLPPPELSH